MRRTATLLMMLVLSAAAWADQPVRVEQEQAGPAGHRVTLTSDAVTVRVAVKPLFIEQLAFAGSADRYDALTPGGASAALVFTGGEEQDAAMEPAGFTVIQHPNGSATLAVALRTDAVRASALFHLEPNAGALTVATVSDNLAPTPRIIRQSFGLAGDKPRSLIPAGLADRDASLPFVGWYDEPSLSSFVVAMQPAHRVRASSKPIEGMHVDASPAGVEPLASMERRATWLSLAGVRQIGHVTGASLFAAVAADRVDGGWTVGVAPYRPLIQGELLVAADAKVFKQTINASLTRPLLLDVPIDADTIDVTLTDRRGGTMLSARIPAGAGSLPPDEASDDQPEAAATFAVALRAMRDGEPAASLNELAKLDGKTGSAAGPLLRAVALRELGRAEEAKAVLTGITDSDPACIEAWLMLGEVQRARELTRYAPAALEAASRAVAAMREGRWPTAGGADAERLQKPAG